MFTSITWLPACCESLGSVGGSTDLETNYMSLLKWDYK